MPSSRPCAGRAASPPEPPGQRIDGTPIACRQQRLSFAPGNGRHRERRIQEHLNLGPGGRRPDGEGTALGNLGLVYHELGQRGRAAECRREAAAAMRDAGDHEQAARLEQLNAGT
jgi:hypothetical protein